MESAAAIHFTAAGISPIAIAMCFTAIEFRPAVIAISCISVATNSTAVIASIQL